MKAIIIFVLFLLSGAQDFDEPIIDPLPIYGCPYGYFYGQDGC